jgi:hypothetical protein
MFCLFWAADVGIIALSVHQLLTVKMAVMKLMGATTIMKRAKTFSSPARREVGGQEIMRKWIRKRMSKKIFVFRARTSIRQEPL